jgi:hypothetical protein
MRTRDFDDLRTEPGERRDRLVEARADARLVAVSR